jgi:hypothetical protein
LDPRLKDKEQGNAMESDVHIQKEKLPKIGEDASKNFKAIPTDITPEAFNANIV